MPPKRRSSVGLDSLESDAGHASKMSRTPAKDSSPTTTGQRFGEAADFIPLAPLSQAVEGDQDDEGAADEIEGGQDEISTTGSILYGMQPPDAF